MPFVICKLPHGLIVAHRGETLNIKGPNEGSDVMDPFKNGAQTTSAIAEGGYGITELNDKQADAFADYVKAVTHKPDGKGGYGEKLSDPFPAFVNGSVEGPYKSIDEARAEARALTDAVTTGFEGIDPATDKAMKAAGIEPDKDAKK